MKSTNFIKQPTVLAKMGGGLIKLAVFRMCMVAMLLCSIAWAQTLVKTASPNVINAPNPTLITYSLTVCNNGNAAANYVVTDTRPAGLITAGTTQTFTITALAAKQCTTITYTAMSVDRGDCAIVNDAAFPLTMTQNGVAVAASNITAKPVIVIPMGYTFMNSGTASALAALNGSPVINGQNFYFDAAFKVDQSISFLNCNIIMAGGASMIVNSKTTLTIDKSEIRGCYNLWDAIYVQSNAGIVVTNSTLRDARAALSMQHQSTLQVTNSAFTNNYVGIYVQPAATSATSYSQIVSGVVTRTTFDGTSNNLKPAYLGASSFVGSLPIGTRAFAGIVAFDCAALNWLNGSGNPTFANASIFQNLHIGIYLQRTSADIRQARFSGIRPVAAYNVGFLSSGIRAKTPILPGRNMPHLFVRGFGNLTTSNIMFNECFTGITMDSHSHDIQQVRMNAIDIVGIDGECILEASAQFSPSLVMRNRIEVMANGQNGWGINYWGNSNTKLDVAENIIQVSSAIANAPVMLIGIKPNGAGPSAITAVNQQLFRRNTITINTSGTTADTDYGIRFEGTQGSTPINSNATLRVGLNDITLNGTADAAGISLQGCRFIDVVNNTVTGGGFTTGTQSGFRFDLSPNVYVACNSTNNTFNGIRFNGYSNPLRLAGNTWGRHTIAVQFNVVGEIGVQPHLGNRWTSNYNWAILNQNSAGAALSQFSIDNTLGNIIAPVSPIIPITAINWASANGQTFNCANSSAAVGLRPLTMTALDHAIATGQYQPAEYPEESLWMAQRDLYKWLNENPTAWAGDTIIEAFVADMDTMPIGQFEALASAGYAFVSPTVQAQWEAATTQIATVQGQLQVADSVWQQNPSDTLSRNAVWVLGRQLEALHRFSDSLGYIIAIGTTEEMDSLRAQNDRIVVTNTLESNEQYLNYLYAATWGVGIDTFSAEQATRLYSIASQCPFMGGRAVYVARSMYASVNRFAQFDDASTCLAEGVIWREGQENTEIKDALATVTPNPTTGDVLLRYTLPNDAVLRVYDLTGKPVLERSLAANTSEATLILTHLPVGMYVYSIVGANAQLQGKISIIR